MIKVVRENRRLVVFRLGQCIGAKGPGVVYLLPFVDRGDALTQRASVGRDLREALGKVAETWGVGLTAVEIREVRRAAASSTP